MLDIADNPVENIIRFFPMVSKEVGRVVWESALSLKGVAFTYKIKFSFLQTKEFIDGCLATEGKDACRSRLYCLQYKAFY